MVTSLVVFIVLLVNGYLSYEVGKVAKTRELGYEKGFWLSFLFSPLLGLLFVLASPQLSNQKLDTFQPLQNNDHFHNEGEKSHGYPEMILKISFILAWFVWFVG